MQVEIGSTKRDISVLSLWQKFLGCLDIGVKIGLRILFFQFLSSTNLVSGKSLSVGIETLNEAK